MKFKKIKKIVFSLLPLGTLPIALSTISFSNITRRNNENGILNRDLSKYSDMHNNLWTHLSINSSEFSRKEVKIGIIDEGLVDSNILMFNNETKTTIDLNSEYSLLENKERLNSRRVKYFSEAILKKESKNDFLSNWKYNRHATKIASILGSDSGFFKNATFYSTTYNRDNEESTISRLRKNLEFFKNNDVKFVNLSYGWHYHFRKTDAKIKNILNAKDDLSEEDITNMLSDVEEVFQNFDYNFKYYNQYSQILDEYAFKYDMKFFVASGNEYDDFLAFKNHINKAINFIRSHKKYRDMIKVEEKLEKLLNFEGIVKRLYLDAGFNTFVIGSYDTKNSEPSKFTNAPIRSLKKTALASSPSGFGSSNLLFNVNNDERINNYYEKNWYGTSFSTPVALGLSLLLSTNSEKEYSVAELRALISASTEKTFFLDPYSHEQRLGFGKISWKKLKYYVKKIKKLELSDFEEKIDESTNSVELSTTIKKQTNNSYLFVLSNLSIFFEEYKKNKEKYGNMANILDENSSYKFINPLYFKISTSAFMSSRKLYEKLHLSLYNIEILEISDDNKNVYKKSDSNPGSIPTEYKIKIIVKDKTYLKEIFEKGIYYILGPENILESDYVNYE